MPAVRVELYQTGLPTSSEDITAAQGLQPFQCLVCQKRFTRHENLKRHSALHTTVESASTFPCHHCPTTFSRPDLRRRHVKRKHPEISGGAVDEADGTGAEREKKSPQSTTLDPTSNQRMPMPTGGWNSSFAQQTGPSVLSTHSQQETMVMAENIMSAASVMDDILSNAFHSIPYTASTPSEAFSPRQDWWPSPSEIAHGLDLFFSRINHLFPFIHKPSFDADHIPAHLLLSILCVACQYGDDTKHDNEFSWQCFHRARKMVMNHDGSTADSGRNLVVIQSYLLLQTYSIMFRCGSDSVYGLRMHTKAIELARYGGLLEPLPTNPKATSDLDSLWREFVKAESHKRTLWAMYQLDASWYHILSIPRALSHLEIKHDMPCSDALWSIPTASEWAHRNLVSKGTEPSVRYFAAIRGVLSPSPSQPAISLEPSGSHNIMHFLLSSIREMSGWSTMTGRLCLERCEALEASLKLMEPDIRPRSGDRNNYLNVEATWEMAMIDLLMWSPSHTSGIVESSLDGALATATYLVTTQASGVYTPVAETLEPHIGWFLSYLNETTDITREPPWIVVFAFKAFLIAWQLLRAGSLARLNSIGVEEPQALVEWGKGVFGRRERWGVGSLITKSLASLES